ncbi:hypothetical protein OL548_25110 [Lysinibacillus sp. MHQ-1]|nr:hypothetical protein OL548_25110 [Lysinibacillus sp. MHQ-1]
MKELGDFKLTILPMVVLLLLTILWKLTESVGAGIILILFLDELAPVYSENYINKGCMRKSNAFKDASLTRRA